MDALAAYVAEGGSVSGAARLLGIRPSTVKRHLADLRARSGLTTEQLIYRGRAEGWLVVPSLDSGQRFLNAATQRLPLLSGFDEGLDSHLGGGPTVRSSGR